MALTSPTATSITASPCACGRVGTAALMTTGRGACGRGQPVSKVERRANERYLSIIAALREIADDETADPKRRKIARDALAADARRGPQNVAVHGVWQPATAPHVGRARGAHEGNRGRVGRMSPGPDFRRYITPWERIEEDGHGA